MLYDQNIFINCRISFMLKVVGTGRIYLPIPFKIFATQTFVLESLYATCAAQIQWHQLHTSKGKIYQALRKGQGLIQHHKNKKKIFWPVLGKMDQIGRYLVPTYILMLIWFSSELHKSYLLLVYFFSSGFCFKGQLRLRTFSARLVKQDGRLRLGK